MTARLTLVCDRCEDDDPFVGTVEQMTNHLRFEHDILPYPGMNAEHASRHIPEVACDICDDTVDGRYLVIELRSTRTDIFADSGEVILACQECIDCHPLSVVYDVALDRQETDDG